MYELVIFDYFSSAHNLRGYKGKCENLHGHNWKVEAMVQARTLDRAGMAIDFRELKQHLKSVLDILDHKYLNDLPYFRKKNPSAENITRFIYLELRSRLKKEKRARLKKVTTWEGINSAAAYWE